MKILSEYKDFYDGVMALDQDRELVYQRRIEEVETNKFHLPDYPAAPSCNYRYHYNETDLWVYQRTVGFCGKTYAVLQLVKEESPNIVFAYSVEDIDHFIQKNFREETFELYMQNESGKKWTKGYGRRSFETFFDKAREVQGNYGNIFQEHKTPIWVYDWNKKEKPLILNAPLKPLEFFRVMDSYTAYQELCMFYGGMALPLKEIPELDDQTKAEISGHGGKYSFRKPPSK